MFITRISIATTMTVALCIAFAGQASAEKWPGGRDGAQLSIQASYPDAVDRAVANHNSHVLAPDDRLRVRPTEALYPDAVSRAVANRKADLFRSAQPASTVQHGKGFDWGSAGIGASTTGALLLVLGIAVGLTRRARTPSAVA